MDAFLAATGIEFREGGSRAFYRRRNKATGEGGYVQMPPRNLFTGTATSTPTEAYEATRLHEAGHASGDEHRLNREFGKRFGDKAYAFEELVALSGQSGRGLSGQLEANSERFLKQKMDAVSPRRRLRARSLLLGSARYDPSQ